MLNYLFLCYSLLLNKILLLKSWLLNIILSFRFSFSLVVWNIFQVWRNFSFHSVILVIYRFFMLYVKIITFIIFFFRPVKWPRFWNFLFHFFVWTFFVPFVCFQDFILRIIMRWFSKYPWSCLVLRSVKGTCMLMLFSFFSDYIIFPFPIFRTSVGNWLLHKKNLLRIINLSWILNWSDWLYSNDSRLRAFSTINIRTILYYSSAQ